MTTWAQVWAEHQRNIGFTESRGPNVNPWTQEMGFGNVAYCSAAASVVPHHQGVQWPSWVQVPPKGEAYSPDWQHFPSWMFDHASRGQPCDLQPGDIVTIDWGGDGVADHTETVVQVYADGTYDTIGYNTGHPEGCHYPIRRNRTYLVGRFRAQGFIYDGTPGPGPGPTPPPAPSGPRVLQQGMKGQDVADLQNQLNRFGYGLVVDGDFGPATNGAVRDFQAKHGLVVDGQVGPRTRAALAGAAPAPGPAPAPPPPPPPPAHGPDGNPFTPLAVDGDFGPQSKRALQWRLNVTEAYSHGPLVVDGDVGPATIRYMQQRLNWSNGPVAVDGQLGPQTIRALQAHTGAGVDGSWGPDTTRHLQVALNNGNF